ncbi:hypothetical protein E2C01_098282 [Portunus trituberculatus]|uniref:Secreted protein n=1 Tax=Portunus trituberculatus TaxID=210409 RepID=A0A5B7K7A1_PORTR|nr:hypothetical protein [Portunus trituberculatus]
MEVICSLLLSCIATRLATPDNRYHHQLPMIMTFGGKNKRNHISARQPEVQQISTHDLRTSSLHLQLPVRSPNSSSCILKGHAWHKLVLSVRVVSALCSPACNDSRGQGTSFYPTGEVQQIYILSKKKNGKKNTSTLKPGPSVISLAR